MAETSGLVQEALDAGHDANTILKEGLIAAMGELGLQFDAVQIVDDYIHFYNYDRIQLKTKLTPFEFRRQFV